MRPQERQKTTRFFGKDAIRLAEMLGLSIHQYASPIDPALSEITYDHARDVCREDPTLIYCDIPDDLV